MVIIFVDDFDLSTIAAMRYAKGLRPTTMRAVHFVIDTEQAEKLRQAWLPDRSVSLEFVDAPDRRLTRAAAELVSQEAATPGTQVTVILPRRSFSPLLGRLLHDRTADKIAGVVSRVPNAAATIIPFDVQNRLRVLQERQAARAGTAPASLTPVPGPPADGRIEPDGRERAPTTARSRAARRPGGRAPVRWPEPSPAEAAAPAAAKPEPLPGAGSYDRPIPPPGVTPIGSIHEPGRTIVEGRVRVVEVRSVERNSVLAAEIADSTGDLTALFYGRSRIPGLMCGSRVRFRGAVGIKDGAPVMINPAYELLVPYTGKPAKDGKKPPPVELRTGSPTARPRPACLHRGEQQLVGRVGHDRVAVLDPDRAAEPDPRPAHDARDVRAPVEHGRELARPVGDLAGQHRVPLHRPDLHHPDPALHGGPPRLGQRPDGRDPRRRRLLGGLR